MTSHRYGEITGKYVIYRGESGSLDGIQYLNVSTDNFMQVVSDAVNNLGACVEKYANQGCLMKRKFGAKQWDKVMTLIENNSNNDD